MKALAIVQARYGATRLPGKVLADIHGLPLLAHVLRRVKASQVDKVVLACPDTDENNPVAAIGIAEDVFVYRGDEDDVLGRFYWAAEMYPTHEPIVRITGEDWAKDPRAIDYALLFWEMGHQGGSDFEYCHLGYRPPKDGVILPAGLMWPIGCDVEIFSRAALAEAHKWATDPYDREHVTSWMADNLGVAMIRNPTPRHGYSCNKKWSVDTAEDLEYARRVYDELYETWPYFGYPEIVEAGL